MSGRNNAPQRGRLSSSPPRLGGALRHALAQAGVVLFKQDRNLKYTDIVWPQSDLDPESILGKTDADLLDHSAEVRAKRAAKQEAMQEGRSVQRTLRATINGETRIYDFSITPFFDETGAPSGVTGVAVDVTQREEVEASLAATTETEVEKRQEAEAAEEQASAETDRLVQLLGQAGHALRSPLTAILGQVSILEQLDADDVTADVYARSLDRLRRSGERLQEAISDVLDLAQFESGSGERMGTQDVEPVDIRKVVWDTAEMLRDEAATKGIGFDLETPDQTVPIRLSRDGLTRIFTNLISNAVKYTNTGHVAVCMTLPDDDTVRVDVHDTGIGIDKAFLQHIFKPFTRSDDARSAATGTGLGLAITKHLVDAAGGRIAIDSTPGEGTDVRVELPRM